MTDLNIAEELSPEANRSPFRKKTSVGKIIALILFLLLLVGAGATYLLWDMGYLPQLDPYMNKLLGRSQYEVTEEEGRYIMELDPLIVTVMVPNTPHQHFQVNLRLVLKKQDDALFIESQMPAVRDLLITHLRHLRQEDLTERNSLSLMRKELVARINQRLNPVKIDNLLFQNAVLQQ